MEKRTALITGCAGYLGSHLAKSLKQSGWKVVGLDYKKHTLNPYVDVMHYADIRNIDELDVLFSRIKFDTVFHLAGRIEAGVSFTEPTEFYSVNVGGTSNILNMMWFHGVEKIVYSSTAAVYQASNTPIKEIDAYANNSPYGNSKFIAEQLIQESGLKYTIFRYFNLAGADVDGEFGEDHQPETHLIPRIIENLNNFQVNGNDFDTPDGTCIRDYVHVWDIAVAHIRGVAYTERDAPSDVVAEVFNLGTNTGISNKQIVDHVAELYGLPFVNYGPNRPGDPDCLVADANKAANILGWTPQYSSLTQIVESAYKWYTKNVV
jgi:UDP-glucose 4-epimerase